MTRPLVSVVLPVKNGGVYLATAVDSILTQTCADLELIVVDDHSTDGATDNLPTSDPRLRIAKSPSAGVIDAANHGATLATGQFLARMDADDISLPDRLERQVEYLTAHPQIDIVGALVEIFSGDGKGGHDKGGVAEGYRLYEEWINGVVTPEEINLAIFTENPIPNPTMMIRRAVFNRLGGYRDIGLPEDYDFFLRAYTANIGMGKVDQVLLRWRDHPVRTTRTDGRYSPLSFMKTRAHHLARSVLLKRPVLIWGAGKNGPLLGRLLKKEGARIDGFIDVNPRRIGKEKVGRPVVAPEEGVANAGDALIVVCVAARGARQEIRAFLHGAGKREGDDYLFVL